MKDIEVEKQPEQVDETQSEPLVVVEPATLTAEQLEELKQRAAKADENWERLLRTTADFDNYKKRATREKQEAVKFANESLLQKLVPVLDSFDMAMAATQNNQPESVQSLQTGIAWFINNSKTLWPIREWKKWTRPANHLTLTFMRQCPNRRPPRCPRARSSNNCAKVINCEIVCCAQPASSWLKRRLPKSVP